MVQRVDRSQWLSSVPDGLRNPLFSAFDEIERNFRERRWEPSELNGGKLCEVVYCVLRGYVDGAYLAYPKKPQNFVQACRDLETADRVRFTQSVRISIPRMLVSLYEIRNNRGVGHVGGEVSANEMDAMIVLQGSKWLVAELIRHFHGLDPAIAIAVVASLTIRVSPLIWSVADKHRVLLPNISMKERTLLLLHSFVEPVHEDFLYAWTEHTNKSAFRRDVLRLLHREKLVEYDTSTGLVYLSPIGVRRVEDNLLKSHGSCSTATA